MLNFKNEYFTLEKGRLKYPTQFKDKSFLVVYGSKEGGITGTELTAHIYKIPENYYEINAGQLDFSNYPNGIENDFLTIRVTNLDSLFSLPLNFTDWKDISPENLTTTFEKIGVSILDIQKRLSEVAIYIDSGKPDQINLPKLPVGCTWYKDQDENIVALPISDLYGKFQQMIDSLHKTIKDLLDIDYGKLNQGLIDKTNLLIKELIKETEKLLDILANHGNNIKPKQVSDIEFLKRTNAKLNEVYEVLGYYKFNDGTTHKRVISNIDDGSGVQLNNGLWANILHNGEVNVSWFGAKKNEEIDNTTAFQKTSDYCAKNKVNLLIPPHNFTIFNTVEIYNGVNINAKGSVIKYTGTESAFRFYKYLNGASVEFNEIQANNGNCIELYGKSGTEYVQYLNLTWNYFWAKDKCIYCRAEKGSWANEIRFYNGRFAKGKYGIYADPTETNGGNNLSGYTFTNIGIEGVDIGLYIANLPQACWKVLSARIAEANIVLKTVGNVNFVYFYANSIFGDVVMDLSPETNDSIIVGITATKRGYMGLNGAVTQIKNGKMYTLNQSLNHKNNYGHSIFDCRTEAIHYVSFGIGGISETTIILSPAYTKFYSENFFYVYDGSGAVTLTIKDDTEKVIYNGPIGYDKTMKFEYDGRTWHKTLIEKATAVSQLNTPYMATKMQQEGVYNDYVTYNDEKIAYDKQQKKIEQDKQLAYKQALKENPNLSYEEFMSVQPMTLNLVEEPQPSEALKRFMEKYL